MTTGFCSAKRKIKMSVFVPPFGKTLNSFRTLSTRLTTGPKFRVIVQKVPKRTPNARAIFIKGASDGMFFVCFDNFYLFNI